ncbi:MAG: hypothetical protein IT449_11835 [Phycisphaerales bacterium]|nr:hypothetical protein [Phycisphaerales bacterium]
MEWSRPAPDIGSAFNSGQPLTDGSETRGAGVLPPALRAAPEIETLGQTEKQYLVVASELPAHPRIRLYWLYSTGMNQERATGPG